MNITLNNPSNVTLGRCLEDDAVSIRFKVGDYSVEVWLGNIEAQGLSVALRDWASYLGRMSLWATAITRSVPGNPPVSSDEHTGHAGPDRRFKSLSLRRRRGWERVGMQRPVAAQQYTTTTVESIAPMPQDELDDKLRDGWHYVGVVTYKTRNGSRAWKTTFKTRVDHSGEIE